MTTGKFDSKKQRWGVSVVGALEVVEHLLQVLELFRQALVLLDAVPVLLLELLVQLVVAGHQVVQGLPEPVPPVLVGGLDPAVLLVPLVGL